VTNGVEMAGSKRRDGELDARWDRAREIVRAAASTPGVASDATLSADAVRAAVGIVRELGCRRVIELGGGASTPHLARALPAGGRLLSLDHDARYLEPTRRALAEQGLADRAEAVLAPIRIRRAGAYLAPGYDFPPLEGQSFDFALIDGPPAREVGRFLTLPMLWPHLAPGALVLVDDTNRADLEGVWLGEWQRLYGGRLRMHREPAFAKGAALLMKDGAGSPAPVPSLAGKYLVRSLKHRLRSGGR
jgi:predicted O-methyltransferase YrrM